MIPPRRGSLGLQGFSCEQILHDIRTGKGTGIIGCQNNGSERHRAVERGLSALMADIETQGESVANGRHRRGAHGPAGCSRSARIDPDLAQPGYQPRRSFPPRDALNELADSIPREKGCHAPTQSRFLIVRPRIPVTDRGFQIVAGERRWRCRAARRLHNCPSSFGLRRYGRCWRSRSSRTSSRAEPERVEEALGLSPT